jgi:hypothetical protein
LKDIIEQKLATKEQRSIYYNIRFIEEAKQLDLHKGHLTTDVRRRIPNHEITYSYRP